MARVWDLPPKILCKKHLIAEHGELHGVWSVIVNGRTGYSRHPEVLRWRGRLPALRNRHNALVSEAAKRGYDMGLNHKTPLPFQPGSKYQTVFINSIEEQIENLRSKNCDCKCR